MIIDRDFLTQEQVNFVENALLLSGMIPWYFNPETTWDDSYAGYRPTTSNTKEIFQLTHALRVNRTTPSDHYDFVNNFIFVKFLEKNNINCNRILRAKMNFVTKLDEDVHQPPHTDDEIPHKVFLYYINDSDGDTILFNEKYGDNPKELTVRERIRPEKGKAILFDGLQYHASSAPRVSNYRAVINISFI